ncbi:hypothetical protein GCM10009861_20290 [Neomicrococcus aestuarii]
MIRVVLVLVLVLVLTLLSFEEGCVDERRKVWFIGALDGTAARNTGESA